MKLSFKQIQETIILLNFIFLYTISCLIKNILTIFTLPTNF